MRYETIDLRFQVSNVTAKLEKTAYKIDIIKLRLASRNGEASRRIINIKLTFRILISFPRRF